MQIPFYSMVCHFLQKECIISTHMTSPGAKALCSHNHTKWYCDSLSKTASFSPGKTLPWLTLEHENDITSTYTLYHLSCLLFVHTFIQVVLVVSNVEIIIR